MGYQLIDMSNDAPSAAPSLTSMPTMEEPENLITTSAVATQDSTCYGGIPSRGIDGNTDGSWSHGSVFHTCDANYPWWMVDLGRDDAHITKVSVYNRSDCCQDRLLHTDVQILDAEGTILASQRINTVNLAHHFTFPNVVGRSVRLYKHVYGVLNVAEVEVLGWS